MALIAVLLGGPCDLTRMVIADGGRPDELRMPTAHSSTVLYGQENPWGTQFRIQVYQRTSRCRHSQTEVFERVREDTV